MMNTTCCKRCAGHSVAKSITAVDAGRRRDGFLSGGGYLFWCFRHLASFRMRTPTMKVWQIAKERQFCRIAGSTPWRGTAKQMNTLRALVRGCLQMRRHCDAGRDDLPARNLNCWRQLWISSMEMRDLAVVSDGAGASSHASRRCRA